MSQKIKLSFLTILVLILMNYNIVFASAIDGLDYVLERDSQFYSFMDTEEYSEVEEILSNYENVIIYKYESSITYLYVYSTNGSFIKQSNGQYKTSEASNFIRIYRYSDSGLWTYRSQYSSTGQAFVPTDILYTNSGVFNESGNIIVPPTNTYKEPYFEFALPLKGYTTLENVDGNIGAYTYTYINTGISNVGNKYLKLGYLYIDQKYLISNLLTSTPQMTKYNLQMTSSWEYILYEGLYKTGLVQNGYTQYQIRIPTEYISTPNYYNIYFKSKDANMQNDVNINFVLLNNQSTGNDGSGGGTGGGTSGGLGPIITPSGDTITGGQVQDGTTLGDIQNTITDIFQPPNQEQANQNAEESINQIKQNITEKLEENEIIGALDLAEQGFIDILEGEAGDFKISWNEVTYKDVALIPKGEVNFSKIARENESVGYIKTTLNTILSAFMAFNILKTLYNLLMEMLGVSSPIINEVTTNDLNLNKRGGKAS